MKQKITLEIQNDTGVEFEERGELREPKHGEYFVAGWSRRIVKNVDKDNTFHSSVVLTPKIDHELESAKKKFPVGSYFKTDYPDYDDFILPVTSVENRGGLGVNIWSGKNGNTSIPCPVERCTPFPLPTWRCCETDKPKVEGLYLSRHKIGKHKHTCRFLNGAFTCRADSNYEWLDEGEL